MFITGELPGLSEDGTVVCFDRETALVRDDVSFLTLEPVSYTHLTLPTILLV